MTIVSPGIVCLRLRVRYAKTLSQDDVLSRRSRRRAVVLALVASAPLIWTSMALGQSGTDADLPRQVEVIRTAYGVPHIYAENLRALGYALAYLQVEDYGERVPLGLLRARGELALHQGRTAIDSDFANRPSFTRAVEIYLELHRDTRSVYEGFAAGVNMYMAQHPEEFSDWTVSPFTGYDVAALYVYRSSAGQERRWVRQLDASAEAPLIDLDGGTPDGSVDEGSSAWAFAPSRTTSGAAILLRNPHLSWEAGYWEAHVIVPGLLDFYGDFRIGAPLGIIGGFNPHLGFATTNNDVDNAQVYALEVDPSRVDHYFLDGTSVPIGRELLTVRFRNGDGYGLATHERLFTDLGPVIHRDHGRIYVLRTPEDGEFRGGEQFLRMIQATTLAEWTEAMRLRAHPRSNFMYADAAGNILFLWNAAMPKFPHPYDDARAVAVTTGDQLWTELHELSELPQLLNPVGGYLRNENDGPWLSNLRSPLNPNDYPEYFEGHEFSLRSQHAQQLVGGDERLSLEEVMLRKHSYRMLLADRVKDELVAVTRDAIGSGVLNTGSVDPAWVASGLTLLEEWDNTVAPESRGGVLFKEWWRRYTEALEADANPTREDERVEFFRIPWSETVPTETPRGLAAPGLAARVFPGAVATTVERFGAWDVAWGDVHRVRRGNVDEPIGGCAGRLGCYRVINFHEDEDGLRRAVGGDGWVLGVEFTSPPRALSVLAYGQSSHEASANHADQAAMFARGEMKEVAFTREDVERGAERRYRPGLDR